MHGVNHPLKEIVVAELKQGIPSSQLSRKYGVAMSTITTWIKELPPDAVPSKYQYRNKRISEMRKINICNARIVDIISDYIVCSITDQEWDQLQLDIQKELIILTCGENKN